MCIYNTEVFKFWSTQTKFKIDNDTYLATSRHSSWKDYAVTNFYWKFTSTLLHALLLSSTDKCPLAWFVHWDIPVVLLFQKYLK